MWTKNTVNFENWEAEVTFRVSGRGRMGADGLVKENCKFIHFVIMYKYFGILFLVFKRKS